MEAQQSTGAGYRSLAARYCSGCLRAARAFKALSHLVRKLRAYHSHFRRDSLHFLLRPLKIPLNVFGRLHAFCEVGPCLGQARSRLCLQCLQFSILSVQLARPIRCQLRFSFRRSIVAAHICVCFARL